MRKGRKRYVFAWSFGRMALGDEFHPRAHDLLSFVSLNIACVYPIFLLASTQSYTFFYVE
jgi:hypothetical protein